MNIFDSHQRELKKLNTVVDKIEALRPAMISLSDEDLRAKTDEFRKRLREGETLDGIMTEAYAVVREAARRVLGMEHFRVQLIGGIILHQGRIAEMCTGEGKTLVATLPAYLNALTGNGVHVVTVNDYLAKRDCEQMGQVHEFLGLSTGCVLSEMSPAERKQGYRCDITYTTNRELGFDYLRDNMAKNISQIVQRGLNYVVLDEIDSILIDEARTPLIIAGQAERSAVLYEACDVLARRLRGAEAQKRLSKLDMISGASLEEHGDYNVDEKEKRVFLTEEGQRRVERFFRIDNIADPANVEIQCHMDLALRANILFKRDRDYVVKDGEVIIVDQSTGRLSPGRQYSDGLHQAIEAKEHVKINKENKTVATVTYQSFFNRYKKISGMTGTGMSEDDEFRQVYGMDVFKIPTNKPILRKDREDLIFKTKKEKLEAVCDDVMLAVGRSQPVLIGTTSVAASEELSAMFVERGIAHSVLNAKFHDQEAAIVAEAGVPGAVTIATNMAGRGTDIKLKGYSLEAGGLLVIGTEKHDSSRIDGQLRGRSGRQGDPGESRFYLSLEDELLKFYGQDRVEEAFKAAGIPEGRGVSNQMLTKAVDKAQSFVEANHFAQRKKLLEYDIVIDKQREVIYDQRREVLESEDVRSIIERLLKNIAADAAEINKEKDGRQDAIDYVKEMLPFPAIRALGFVSDSEFCSKLEAELIRQYEYIGVAFDNPQAMLERERVVLLEAVDAHWMKHIDDLSMLRQGIGLMAYAQKDPVDEYRRAASKMFEEMNREIRMDAASAILQSGTNEALKKASA